MKREEIEKAGREYAGLTDNPKDPYSRMKGSLCIAFKDGANWHINSMWHETKNEVPQIYGEYENENYPQIPCLVLGYLSTGYGYGCAIGTQWRNAGMTKEAMITNVIKMRLKNGHIWMTYYQTRRVNYGIYNTVPYKKEYTGA